MYAWSIPHFPQRRGASWKVDAQLRWLWAVVTEQVTFSEILPGRGFAQAKKMLGAGYGLVGA
jgi:hypothetical protein